MSQFFDLTILGIVTGSIYAVGASGLVVTYTTSGVFNFAHGAVGMMAAFLYWTLRIQHNLSAPLALFVVIFVAAPLFGAGVERLLIRNLRGAPPVTYMVVTIGLMLGLIGAANSIWPPSQPRSIQPFFGPTHLVRIGGVNITWHQLTTIAVAILVAVLLRLFLFRTRLGVTMRAQVDNRDLTALNGARPDRVSTLSWALGSVLAAVAGILFAPILQLDIESLTLLVVNAYAAAMIGRLRSLPLTYLGGLMLGLATEYCQGYLPSTPGFFQNLPAAVPTLFLFATLLFIPEGRLRGAGMLRSVATKIPSLRVSLLGAAVLVAGVAVLMATLNGSYVIRMCSALALGLVMLSLVPLTGYAGQVSLAQLTFAGIGAFVMVKLGAHGSPLAVLAGAGLAAVVGAIAALPALRLQGLYLALSTMAFALLATYLFFDDDRVFGQLGSATVSRVRLFGYNFANNRIYGVLLGVVFALVSIGVLALRRGSFGRRLAAMRDSPAACATLGMSTVRTKVAVFALSAGIAGLAGALLGGVNNTVSSAHFEMLQSLPVLLLAVIGGITAVTGALTGGILLAVFFPFFTNHVLGILDVVAIAVGIVVISNIVKRTAPGSEGAPRDDEVHVRRGSRRVMLAALGGAAVVAVFVFAHDHASRLQDLVFLGTGLAGVTLGRSPDGVAIDIANRVRELLAVSGVSQGASLDDQPIEGMAAEEAGEERIVEGELSGKEPSLVVYDVADEEVLEPGGAPAG